MCSCWDELILNPMITLEHKYSCSRGIAIMAWQYSAFFLL